MSAVIALRGIVKRFGPLTANNGIDFDVLPGEVHALLGENGAGKTTLMKIMYGLYHPDAGTIEVQGRPIRFHSPADALKSGIGMVTQHFALVPRLTVTENMILGREPGMLLDRRLARRRVQETAERFRLAVDPDAEVRHLSVGEQQRVEILKALYRDCRLLILDEPTAVLTPQESQALFAILRDLTRQGLSIVFISHKLEEVLSVSDRITVLRNGQVVHRVAAAEATPSSLARMMVGREVFAAVPASWPLPAGASPVLEVDGVAAADDRGLPVLKGVSLTVHGGEILGLTGVAGNGQSDLVQILSGLRRPAAGHIRVDGRDITGAEPADVTRAGLGRIPEDRLQGVVADLSVAENIALESLDDFTGLAGRVDRARMIAYARRLMKEFQIKAEPHTPVRLLSGGNMQKVILARVLARQPRAILAAQPTRGLDVSATEYIHGQLLRQRGEGAGVLLVSEDLDEVLTLSDRIAVIYEGRIVGIIRRDQADPERLGLMMSGAAAEAGVHDEHEAAPH